MFRQSVELLTAALWWTQLTRKWEGCISALLQLYRIASLLYFCTLCVVLPGKVWIFPFPLAAFFFSPFYGNRLCSGFDENLLLQEQGDIFKTYIFLLLIFQVNIQICHNTATMYGSLQPTREKVLIVSFCQPSTLCVWQWRTKHTKAKMSLAARRTESVGILGRRLRRLLHSLLWPDHACLCRRAFQ